MARVQLILLALLAGTAHTQTRRFEQRHPLGLLKVQGQRFAWKRSWLERVNPAGDYAVARESFELFLPTPDGRGPTPGLFVWVSPGGQGTMPRPWHAVLAKHSLIGVGANNAGNDREIWFRVGLALDAVHNLTRSRAIDATRMYVAGFSGGGRIASRIGMLYPDVFTGGIYMGGCNYYRPIPVPKAGKREWPARFPAPRGRLSSLSKRSSRHVILVGSEDMNRDHSHGIYTRMKKRDGFKHVTFLEMSGLGHTWPAAAWLDRAIVCLDSAPTKTKRAPVRRARVVRKLPHDEKAFTQGLAFSDGWLYESTGIKGRSTARRVALETGKVNIRRDLEPRYFGEGLAVVGDHVIQLTWRSGDALVYDKQTLTLEKRLSIPTAAAWGLTWNGVHLLMSDGTDRLRFLDPKTLAPVREVLVTDGPMKISQLNELEYVKGEVLANVWKTTRVARIDPQTGRVKSWIELAGLTKWCKPKDRDRHVLNGIAWDQQGDRLYVTGKHWPWIFEIEVPEK